MHTCAPEPFESTPSTSPLKEIERAVEVVQSRPTGLINNVRTQMGSGPFSIAGKGDTQPVLRALPA